MPRSSKNGNIFDFADHMVSVRMTSFCSCGKVSLLTSVVCHSPAQLNY